MNAEIERGRGRKVSFYSNRDLYLQELETREVQVSIFPKILTDNISVENLLTSFVFRMNRWFFVSERAKV